MTRRPSYVTAAVPKDASFPPYVSFRPPGQALHSSIHERRSSRFRVTADAPSHWLSRLVAARDGLWVTMRVLTLPLFIISLNHLIKFVYEVSMEAADGQRSCHSQLWTDIQACIAYFWSSFRGNVFYRVYIFIHVYFL